MTSTDSRSSIQVDPRQLDASGFSRAQCARCRYEGPEWFLVWFRTPTHPYPCPCPLLFPAGSRLAFVEVLWTRGGLEASAPHTPPPDVL